MVIAGLAWPIWKLRKDYRMIADTNGAAAIGVFYSLGFASTLFVGLWYNLLVAGFESTDPINLEMMIIAVSATIGSFLLLLTIATIASVILWRLIRLTLPKFVTQDGTLCPRCAYCLIGVQSLRCPECGNAFTYDDLETTETEFTTRSQRTTTE